MRFVVAFGACLLALFAVALWLAWPQRPEHAAAAVTVAPAAAPASAQPTDDPPLPLTAQRLETLYPGRSFAKPLPLERDGLLLFVRDGGQALVERIDWRTNTSTREHWPVPPLDDKLRYSAVRSSAGTWLVGPQVLLRRDDGTFLQQPFDANEPAPAVLPDGSVLVLGDLGGRTKGPTRIQRLVASPTTIEVSDLGLLSYDGQPDRKNERYREPGYGFTATVLDAHRELFVGGSHTNTLASIFDPATGAMRAVAPSPHPRTFAVATLLPDGRVVVAGAEHLRCYEPGARLVDVYDPRTDAWSALPPLPFPLCSDAYYADVPALAVAPNGDLVAGAHLEQHVMTLAAAGGYASSWRIEGALALPHISGVLQALADGNVVVAGGVHNPEQFGGCCRGTPGIERIVRGTRTAAIGLDLQGTGIARRGKLALLAAGRRFGWTGTGQMRYSSAAELLHLDDGTVEPLDNLPFASGAADAVWLDDDRVLVKGRVAAEDRGFEPGENLSSYLPASSGDAAIWSRTTQRWTSLALPAGAANGRLVGARDSIAFVLGGDGGLVAVDVATGKERTPALPALARRGGVLRWLDDGRVVLAGGQTPAALVSQIDAACEAERTRECPERYVGFGAYAPVRRYQIAPPGADAGAVPQLSAPAQGETASAVIEADGSVTQIGWTDAAPADVPDSRRLVIETARDKGQKWTMLPFPRDLVLGGDRPDCTASAPGDCRLALVADPRDPGRELLFLTAGTAYGAYAAPDAHVRVWWYVPNQGRWERVVDVTGQAAHAPVELPAPLSDSSGTLVGAGWQLESPVVWVKH